MKSIIVFSYHILIELSRASKVIGWSKVILKPGFTQWLKGQKL